MYMYIRFYFHSTVHVHGLLYAKGGTEREGG